MNARKFAAVVLTGAALLLAGVGIAQADPEDGTEGYPSTQSQTQVVDAVLKTGETLTDCFTDAVNGENRPNGADGAECEFFGPDPRFIEGPVGGLLNGPFD